MDTNSRKNSILLIIICLYSVSCRSHSISNDKKFIDMCNETSTISLNTMNEFLINKNIVENNKNEFKCFLHCLYTKYEWMDEDGGFLLTQIRNGLEETAIEVSILELILYKCTANPSVDRCQRAFQFTECFWDKIKHSKDDENESLTYKLDEFRKIKPMKYYLFP